MPLPVLAGLNVAGQLATPLISAATYAFDPQRKRNRQAIKGLETDIEAGRGLDDRERQLLMSTGMAPVRATAGSMASELGRLQAAGGGLGGGAALAANRQAVMGAVGGAAEKVGSRVAAADIDALAGKREELAARQNAQAMGRSAFIGQLADIGTQQLTKMGEQRGAGATGAAPVAAPQSVSARTQVAIERAMVPYEMRARFDAEVASGKDPRAVRMMMGF